MPLTPLRILVVDDHPLMRQAICATLRLEDDLAVIGEAADGAAAVEQARALLPDVVVMDLMLPVKDGVQAITELHAELPAVRILTLTSLSNKTQIVAALQAGAHGYVVKDAQGDQLVEAIRQVGRGHGYLPPPIAGVLLEHMQQDTAPAAAAALTPREAEVLAWVGQGLGNQEIADRLNVAEATVRVHVHNLLTKLGLANRKQLIVHAAQKGRLEA